MYFSQNPGQHSNPNLAVLLQPKTIVAPLDHLTLSQALNPSWSSIHEFSRYTECRLIPSCWYSIHKDSKTGTLGLFQGHSATHLHISPYTTNEFLTDDEVRKVRLTAFVLPFLQLSSTRSQAPMPTCPRIKPAPILSRAISWV